MIRKQQLFHSTFIDLGAGDTKMNNSQSTAPPSRSSESSGSANQDQLMTKYREEQLWQTCAQSEGTTSLCGEGGSQERLQRVLRHN